jgi:uncharacterized membrane protein
MDESAKKKRFPWWVWLFVILFPIPFGVVRSLGQEPGRYSAAEIAMKGTGIGLRREREEQQIPRCARDDKLVG